MMALPKAAEPLILALSVAFSRPTFQRVVVLVVGAILALGRRTVTAVRQAAGPLAPGHWSASRRVLCRAAWSVWPLGKVLAALLLKLIPKDQPVVTPVDDTAAPHKGKKVWGTGRHDDALRSTHSHVVWLWEHEWVTLVINVEFPFAVWPWALAVLCTLYRPEEQNRAAGQRHTPRHALARQDRSDLQRRDHDRASLVMGDDSETGLGTYACDKTPGSFTHHAAGLPQLRGVRLQKRQKSNLVRPAKPCVAPAMCPSLPLGL